MHLYDCIRKVERKYLYIFQYSTCLSCKKINSEIFIYIHRYLYKKIKYFFYYWIAISQKYPLLQYKQHLLTCIIDDLKIEAK